MKELRRTLAGRYDLDEVIGRGGMGTVYRAVDRALGRQVAVKLLPGLLAEQDPTAVARFEREARAAAALNNPAVVAIYDTGADEDTRFIVMELVSGRSLDAILRDEGRLDVDRGVGIAAQVAGALAAAHGAGIAHRDVKPANVMVARDGSVKILDFGIARALDATALTQTPLVVGTAAYMSPEQALGKPADERSDIYSLGCVLYAMLAGHPPFRGDATPAVLNQHAHVAPLSLQAENPRVSGDLDALVMQMLAKSPEERPQTAGLVRDRLTSLGAGGKVAPTAPTTRLAQTAFTRELPHAGRRDRAPLIAAAALVALAVLIVVILLASGGSPHHRAAARRGVTTTPAARSTTPTAPPTSSSTTPATNTSTTTTSKPLTVSGAAGALTSLITQDVQAGTIDQQAGQQITHALSDALSSYESGHTADAQHKLADLSQQLPMLEQHGDINPAAAPTLNAALGNLGVALANAPATTTQAPSGPPGQPPGPGAEPGKTKHGGPKGH